MYCGCPTDSFWPEHVHGFAQVLLTYSPVGGELVWKDAEGNKNRESLRDGHVYFVGPSVPHSLKWGRGYMVVFYLAPRHDEELEELLRGKVCVQFLSRVAGHDQVVCTLMELYRHWSRERLARDYPIMLAATRAVVDCLTRGCIALHGDEPGRTDRLSPRQFALVTDHMKKHLHESVRVRDLAKLVFRSPKHFMRLFKNTTGVPAVGYFRRLKTERAEELLRSGNYSIAEVVSELGFCDQSHLTRYCRNFLKTTPRKLLLAGNVPKMATPVQDIG